MTPSEYRDALDSLTDEQYESFRISYGAKPTRKGSVGALVDAVGPVRAQLEERIIYGLSKYGLTGLRTEQQKALDAAERSATANRDSADASRRSAEAAERAAAAAESSAASAREARRTGWYAVVVALVAIVVTLAQWRGC